MTRVAATAGEIELADWRRQVAELYAAVRAAPDPSAGHALWRAGRDRLFAEHPQSPLPADDPLRRGLRYAPYDPRLRWQLELGRDGAGQRLTIATGTNEHTNLRRLGCVRLPSPVDATIAVWWLEQYGGGLFIPIRDQTAGTVSYGGGRYLLDTAKGADLGARDGRLTIDLNFLYHPSCRYDPHWQCPLAPPANVIAAPVDAGERL
jgi:uncharacterized protein